MLPNDMDQESFAFCFANAWIFVVEKDGYVGDLMGSMEPSHNL